MNKKVLIINDYFKQHYIGYSNGKPINVFKRTNDGVYLSGMLKLALKTKGYDDNVDWEAAFAYPAIPNVIKENKRNPELTIYQPPLPEQVKEKNGELFAKIREVDPDMIVVAGSIAAKAVTGVGTLSRLRSKETVIDILGKEYPLTATYSPGYVLGNPNSKELATLDFEMVAAYLKDGKNSLKKKEVDYTILTNKDVDKILSVISLVKTVATSPEKAVALDYETNTLSGTAEESKILSVSLSFSENTGVTFPIDHPDSPLSEDDKTRVVAALMDMYASEAYLVLHNASFDLAQTKTIFGPVEFKHTMDTLVAFFMLVSQDDSVPKNLKHLAVQYTDMGEYDSELDDFKSWFSLGFTGTRAKKLKDIYLKPFTYKVQEQLEGKYQLEDSDFLPYMTDDDRKSSLATATRLLERFGTYNKIRNEFDEDDNFSYAWIPYPIMAKYACGDVDATKRIHKRFIKQMADNDEFYNLYTSHYPELINVTTNLQALGATIDIPYLEKTAQVFDEELDRLYAEMLELPEVKKTVQYKESLFKLGMEEKKKAPADRDKEKYKYYTAYRKEGALEFNPRSKLDLHYALFSDKANWPSIDSNFVTDSFMKKLRNNQVLEEDITYLDFKTDKETLDEVLRKNPDSKFAQYFKTYGRLNKLNSTYTRALVNRADSEGQLHGSYSVTTAATTRLSSKNPNMQNISKPTNDPSAFDYDYPIKNAFIPNFKKGQDTIINLDFSSQEAHLAAVIADDESMIESFMEGKDVHSETAALIYDVPSSEVTKDQRQSAKSVTFG